MGHLSFHHGEGFAHSSMMQQARVTRHTCQRPRMRDGSCGGGGGNVTIGRSVATKGGKTSLHIPLRQVGQVARGRRAVGAAYAVESPLLRSARPETPHGIGVSGVGVVEFSRKFPKCLPVLPEQSALMGDTCRLFRADLPTFCDFSCDLPNIWSDVLPSREKCLPLQHVQCLFTSV